TAHDPGLVGMATDEAFALATSRHRGPVFLDASLEALYGTGGPADASAQQAGSTPGLTDGDAAGQRDQPDPDSISEIGRLLAEASRPVLIIGSDVWLDGGERAARTAAEELR